MPAINQVIKKIADVRLVEASRMRFTVEEDELPAPVNVRLLGPWAETTPTAD